MSACSRESYAWKASYKWSQCRSNDGASISGWMFLSCEWRLMWMATSWLCVLSGCSHKSVWLFFFPPSLTVNALWHDPYVTNQNWLERSNSASACTKNDGYSPSKHCINDRTCWSTCMSHECVCLCFVQFCLVLWESLHCQFCSFRVLRFGFVWKRPPTQSDEDNLIKGDVPLSKM